MARPALRASAASYQPVFIGPELQGELRTTHSKLYQSGRIVVLDKYLSQTELMSSLAAMDLVCTPYADFLGTFRDRTASGPSRASGARMRTAEQQ